MKNNKAGKVQSPAVPSHVCCQGGSASQKAGPLPGQPVPGTSQAVSGTCQAVPGTCQAVPGTSQVVPGTCQAVPGACQAVSGTSQAVPGTCQAVSGNCQAGHTCCGHHSAEAVSFQQPTVQPVLEAWIESVKRDMLQKQDQMLQMMRMEMLQARPPLVRGAYGLLPSF